MDEKEIVSTVNKQVQCILTKKLEEYFDEAKLAIEIIKKKEGIKINERDKLQVIFKSLKDISTEMIVESIRNSSLDDYHKCLLNILCGNPRVAILVTPTKTKEEKFSDELILSNKKQPVQKKIVQKIPYGEWPGKDVEVDDKD